jgi:hypothetical protein
MRALGEEGLEPSTLGTYSADALPLSYPPEAKPNAARSGRRQNIVTASERGTAAYSDSAEQQASACSVEYESAIRLAARRMRIRLIQRAVS